MTDDEAARDTVTRLLRKVEQGVNRRGWDQPAMLAELHWPLGARPYVKLIPEQLPDPVGAYLRFQAKMMTSTALGRALTQRLAVPSFYGMALFSEGWANTELTPEQARDRTQPLADIVGSYESRDVTAVDIRGEFYNIHRRRGCKPVERRPSDEISIGGRCTAALRDMVLAVVELLPAAGRAQIF